MHRGVPRSVCRETCDQRFIGPSPTHIDHMSLYLDRLSRHMPSHCIAFSPRNSPRNVPTFHVVLIMPLRSSPTDPSWGRNVQGCEHPAIYNLSIKPPIIMQVSLPTSLQLNSSCPRGHVPGVTPRQGDAHSHLPAAQPPTLPQPADPTTSSPHSNMRNIQSINHSGSSSSTSTHRQVHLALPQRRPQSLSTSKSTSKMLNK